ncbi:hypothetical protein GDO81_023337, partial [Engystomops pustulosus]
PDFRLGSRGSSPGPHHLAPPRGPHQLAPPVPPLLADAALPRLPGIGIASWRSSPCINCPPTHPAAVESPPPPHTALPPTGTVTSNPARSCSAHPG